VKRFQERIHIPDHRRPPAARLFQTGESKAGRLLIGSIDVRQLVELAKLDAVIRMTPVVT